MPVRSQISSDGISMSGGDSGPGEWQLFGDGTDLTLSLESGESFLFPRIIIARWDLKIEQDILDVARLGEVWQEFRPGNRSARLHLEIIPSGPLAFDTEGGLWIPDRQIKQLSITELFGIINQKIDAR